MPFTIYIPMNMMRNAIVGNGAGASGSIGLTVPSVPSNVAARRLLGPIDAQYLDNDGETEFGRISDVALWA